MSVAGGTAGGTAGGWPGRRLGAPPSGTGSVARAGRRVVALLVDWFSCTLISLAFFDGDGWATLAVFTAEQLLLVATLGASFGHALCGLRVRRLGGGPAGPAPALVRAVLLALAVPALVWDVDQRGLHDRLAKTVLLRR